jgi:hypothetical protein
MLVPVPAGVAPQEPVYQCHVAPVVSVPFTVSVAEVPAQTLWLAVIPVGALGCVVTFTTTALLFADVPQELFAAAV